MAKGAKKRMALDLAYRKALGLPERGPLPNEIGTQSSAGGARGGRGAASKGKGLRK